MRDNLSRRPFKEPKISKKNPQKQGNMESLLEDYTSKLEQKVVSQTQQLKTITDNAASSLFMIDIEGKPTFMNPAAEMTTGYSLEEIKNRILHNVAHYAHPDGSPYPIESCPIMTAFKNMTFVKDQEDIFFRKDGSVFPISFSVAPLIQDGKPQGAVLEFQDITKRKELERQKDDFIGVASHELKTPVTSLKTYTQVLKRRFEKQGDMAAAESLKKIDIQINKLTALITDLLDVTRSQTGNLNFRLEKFNFDALVTEVVENIQLTTLKHIIEIKGKTGVEILADRDRTGQVLINLLSNAIKYSPASNSIVVHLSRNKKEILVGIEDFGIGIPTDKIDQIFDRFMRVSGQAMETFAGLGLGLYISAQIIKRLGGKIWVESKLNQGSTFYFTLPLR
jgi:PAS domain S-box-containing protein